MEVIEKRIIKGKEREILKLTIREELYSLLDIDREKFISNLVEKKYRIYTIEKFVYYTNAAFEYIVEVLLIRKTENEIYSEQINFFIDNLIVQE